MANLTVTFQCFAFAPKVGTIIPRLFDSCHGLVMQQESEMICERHQYSCGYGQHRGAIYKPVEIEGLEKREGELC